MKKLIAGNWKMNGTLASATGLATDIITQLGHRMDLLKTNDFAIFPPYVHLKPVQEALIKGGAAITIATGGQDCSATANGAYTGEVSADMLKDLGCEYVILGHSERRQYHGETDEKVALKAARAHEKGLVTIICVGEKESERDAGLEQEVVASQLGRALPANFTALNTVIAYEPVWAIGTGKTATPDDVRTMHKFIRDNLSARLKDAIGSPRILYGGSVKPDNAKDLMAVEHVNGALIGGASLKVADYLAIAAAS